MNKTRLASDIKRCVAASKESSDLKISALVDKLAQDIKDLKNTRHVNAKGLNLTEQNNEIISKFNSGKYTQSMLAVMYNLSRQRISQIVRKCSEIVDTTEEDINELVYRFTVDKEHVERKTNKELIENLEKIININILVK